VKIEVVKYLGKSIKFQIWDEPAASDVAESIHSFLEQLDGASIDGTQLRKFLHLSDEKELFGKAQNWATKNHPEWLIDALKGQYHICRSDYLCSSKWSLHYIQSARGILENILNWMDEFEIQYDGKQNRRIRTAFRLLKNASVRAIAILEEVEKEKAVQTLDIQDNGLET
jgi:hypothetical protein